MSSKQRLLVLVGVLAGVCGLLAAGWFLVAAPYLDRVKVVEKAEAEARAAKAEVDDLRDLERRLKPLEKRSLPAGPRYPDDPKREKADYATVARREYEKALLQVLKDSGVRGANLNPSDQTANDKAGIPQLEKPASKDADPVEYLAYTLVAFKIDIPKTDLTTLADILRRYYSLDILHQITHLTIRQGGGGELGEDKRPLRERNDLKVEIVTRAAIVNGAPRRNTLTPAPAPLIALTGGIGGDSYEQSVGLGQRMIPPPLEPILANAPVRDYTYLAAKDVYHGTLPQIPPPPKKVDTKEEEYVPPPKPDFREYIWYTTSFHTIDGDEHKVEVFIRDKANNEDYTLTVTQRGEKVVPKVTKFYYDTHKLNPADRKKKEYMNQETLEISKASMMSNKNNFTVYGVDTDGSLVLGERPTGPEVNDKKPATPGGRPAKPTLPTADPKAAVAGGLVVMAPRPEKFYRWEQGKSLKQIVELTKAEADKAIRRAQTRFLPTATTTDAPTPTEAKGGE